ncbi:hypothetical protein ACHAXT_011703 [Thalassiosira profunda]
MGGRCGIVVSIVIPTRESFGADLSAEKKTRLSQFSKVYVGSQAETAGLLAGDMPLSLGKRISYDAFLELVKRGPRPLTFHVFRNAESEAVAHEAGFVETAAASSARDVDEIVTIVDGDALSVLGTLKHGEGVGDALAIAIRQRMTDTNAPGDMVVEEECGRGGGIVALTVGGERELTVFGTQHCLSLLPPRKTLVSKKRKQRRHTNPVLRRQKSRNKGGRKSGGGGGRSRAAKKGAASESKSAQLPGKESRSTVASEMEVAPEEVIEELDVSAALEAAAASRAAGVAIARVLVGDLLQHVLEYVGIGEVNRPYLFAHVYGQGPDALDPQGTLMQYLDSRGLARYPKNRSRLLRDQCVDTDEWRELERVVLLDDEARFVGPALVPPDGLLSSRISLQGMKP